MYTGYSNRDINPTAIGIRPPLFLQHVAPRVTATRATVDSTAERQRAALRSGYSTGAGVGESGSVRAEQLVLVEVDRRTDGARLAPANAHRLHVVDHAAARGSGDRQAGRAQAAAVAYLSVAQRTARVYTRTTHTDHTRW